jgi:hypothetical protein
MRTFNISVSLTPNEIDYDIYSGLTMGSANNLIAQGVNDSFNFQFTETLLNGQDHLFLKFTSDITKPVYVKSFITTSSVCTVQPICIAISAGENLAPGLFATATSTSPDTYNDQPVYLFESLLNVDYYMIWSSNDERWELREGSTTGLLMAWLDKPYTPPSPPTPDDDGTNWVNVEVTPGFTGVERTTIGACCICVTIDYPGLETDVSGTYDNCFGEQSTWNITDPISNGHSTSFCATRLHDIVYPSNEEIGVPFFIVGDNCQFGDCPTLTFVFRSGGNILFTYIPTHGNGPEINDRPAFYLAPETTIYYDNTQWVIDNDTAGIIPIPDSSDPTVPPQYQPDPSCIDEDSIVCAIYYGAVPP